VTPLPTFAIVGAGNRGADVYAAWLLRHPDRGRVVAAADTNPERLERFAATHALPPESRFASADALLAAGRLADALIVATPDVDHVDTATRALAQGYHLLLEKPMATDAAGIARLAAAARAAPGSVTVAHVLRYTPFFRTLRRLIEEGRVGRLVNVEHTEHIGFWHFAHSYVRGNWRREALASPMILAKACHDLDMLRWLVGAPCERLASFGELTHFRASQAPPGAGERCLDCTVEASCPYSARRIYLERFATTTLWPVSVLGPDTSLEGRERALREGPYGRCVYRCDNDVADHQVLTLAFAGGVTATLTVIAFSEANTRTITVSGTHGEISGRLDDGALTVRDFVTGRHEVVEASGAGVHAGGDDGLMDELTTHLAASLADAASARTSSDWEASLESHAMAFAAERSRHDGTVVNVAVDLERLVGGR
jgi:predicted dehydrogenase